MNISPLALCERAIRRSCAITKATKMQALRRIMTRATRTWSAARVVGWRQPIFPLHSLLKTASCTSHMSHRMAWQNVKPVDTSAACLPPRAAGATIAAANLQPDRQMLKVQWGSGGEDVYPYIWLRDNCQCPACFHPVSLARRLMLKDLSLSINGASVKVTDGGDQLEVHWTDGHCGRYNADWLHERAFRQPRPEPRDRRCRLKQEYWGREMQEAIPQASFSELLEDNDALLAFVENLEVSGVVLVSGVPTQLRQIHRLTERVGYLKPTHYGETFEVETKSDPNNLAYTRDSLDLHSDLSSLATKPEQISGEGGDTLLTDAHAAALKLREKNPRHFDTLAETLVDFVDRGSESVFTGKFHCCWRAPAIQLNDDGSIWTVNLHQMSRDSHFYASSEEVAAWYSAYLAFRDILYDPNNLIKIKLLPGNLMVLDNLRILHGRQGYRADSGERLLEGGYWEWDSVRSLRRVLRKEMVT
ncbi:Gamma-butyrobetaine dioxygenase [Chionoecetes opilio]|uniref:Gamma-butyrobetaine dioxygenase n=1 Tax=Chionoecetes opilio TaxID=41210 RepID=A0A8J4XZY9_CHIOP|nr:Gamma-butyrobetaine dioxygenase [Chionoecetes opilio]